jgi:hypothetical protein
MAFSGCSMGEEALLSFRAGQGNARERRSDSESLALASFPGNPAWPQRLEQRRPNGFH